MSDCGRANWRQTTAARHVHSPVVAKSSRLKENSRCLRHGLGLGWNLAPPTSCCCSHLLASIHLFAVPVAVTRIRVHADQGAAGVGLVSRRNCQGGESCRWGGGGGIRGLIRTFVWNACKGSGGHAQLPVMELRTSLEKEASTELP